MKCSIAIAFSRRPPTVIVAFCIRDTTVSGVSGIPSSKMAFIMHEL
uniref:Uncharacterized protein n=1 Tax=Rhizophora mucronata TaxID=61149 RepID=A0A2P2Q9L8_RHIMU